MTNEFDLGFYQIGCNLVDSNNNDIHGYIGSLNISWCIRKKGLSCHFYADYVKLSGGNKKVSTFTLTGGEFE